MNLKINVSILCETILKSFFVKFNLQAGRATGKSTEGNTRRVKYQACYEENRKILKCKDCMSIFLGAGGLIIWTSNKHRSWAFVISGICFQNMSKQISVMFTLALKYFSDLTQIRMNIQELLSNNFYQFFLEVFIQLEGFSCSDHLALSGEVSVIWS